MRSFVIPAHSFVIPCPHYAIPVIHAKHNPSFPSFPRFMESMKIRPFVILRPHYVIPAKAGIQMIFFPLLKHYGSNPYYSSPLCHCEPL
jgi:hypothetical protein